LAKEEEEEEVQEDVQRNSMVVKEYMKKLCKICS